MEENNQYLSQSLMKNNHFFKNKKEVKCINVSSDTGFRNLGGSIFVCGFSKTKNTDNDGREEDVSATADMKKFSNETSIQHPYPSCYPFRGQLLKIEKVYEYNLLPVFFYTFNMSQYQSPMLIFSIDNLQSAEIPKIACGTLSNNDASTRASSTYSKLRSERKCGYYWKKMALEKKCKVCGYFSSLSDTSALDTTKYRNFDEFHQHSVKPEIWSGQKNEVWNVEFLNSDPDQHLILTNSNCKIVNIPRNLPVFSAGSAENLKKISGGEKKLLLVERNGIRPNQHELKKETEIQKLIFQAVKKEKQVDPRLTHTTEHESSSLSKAGYDFENSCMKEDDAPKFVDELFKMKTDPEFIFGSEKKFSTINSHPMKIACDSTKFLTDIRKPDENYACIVRSQWTNPYYDGKYNSYDKAFPTFLRKTRILPSNNRAVLQKQSDSTSYYSLFGTSSGIELSKII